MALAVGMVMLWLRRVCGRVRVQPASAPSWLANLRPSTRRKAAGGAHGSPVTLPIEPRNPRESNSGPVCRVYMTCELPNLRGSEELFGGIGFFIRKTRHAREGLCK